MTTFKSLPAVIKRNEFRTESFKRNSKFKKPVPLAWDTETDGLGGELLCATYSNTTDNKIISGSPDEICETLLKVFSKQCLPRKNMPDFSEYGIQDDNEFKSETDEFPVWYAHNAGYDLRYFIDFMIREYPDDYRLEIGMRTDTDIFEVKVVSLDCTESYYDDKMKVHAKTFILRDSMAIFPTSLKKFTKEFAHTQKSTNGPNFEAGEKFNIQNLNHTKYAIDDAISLREAMTAYQKIVIEDYGVPLSATAAGTALKAWKATLTKKEEYFITESHKESAIRDAYYGGLVFLTSTNIHKNAKTFDINSSYPANMRANPMPDGRTMSVERYYTHDEALGIFNVTLRSPENLVVPVIPKREKDQICWHAGTITSTLTNVDIDSAIEKGYELEEFHSGFIFEDVCYPFQTFVDRAEEIRKRAKGSSREIVAKQMQNSLYGKFGSSKVRSSIFHPVSDDDYLNALPLSTECAPIDSYFWIRKENNVDMPIKIEWAAFITAYARRTLLNTVYAVGPEKCIYGDTDSITITEDADDSVIDGGSEYGQFKLEKTWTTFRALGPKLYTGFYNDKHRGACKGLAKSKMTEAKWIELLETGKTSVETLQLDNLKAVLRKNSIELAKITHRKSSTLNNSASYIEDENGNVRPLNSRGAQYDNSVNIKTA